MRRTLSLALTLALAAGPVGAASATEAMRCGTRIITRGDPADKMLHFCGEPAAVSTRYAQRPVLTNYGHVYLPGFVEDVLVEDWTYNLGPHQFMRLVRIENGIVADIKQLGYGY
jgi:Protein of unknown function (DUF2845)